MSGVNFSQKILPVMKRNQWGRILFISSEKAIEPGKGMAPYAMTKTAQLSLVKSLANELGEYGITVNSVSPGVILTPVLGIKMLLKPISVEKHLQSNIVEMFLKLKSWDSQPMVLLLFVIFARNMHNG